MDVSIVCCWFWFVFPFCLISSGWVGWTYFSFSSSAAVVVVTFSSGFDECWLGLGLASVSQEDDNFFQTQIPECDAIPPSPVRARGASSQGSSETTLAK
jgi:hypothetical protein